MRALRLLPAVAVLERRNSSNNEKTAKLNLIVCGSINRLMRKILTDDQEPLYGRNTGSLRVAPFRISVLSWHTHGPMFSGVS